MFKKPQGQSQQSLSGDNNSGGVKGSVFRIKPYHYIHVLDTNNGVTSVIVGPRTFTRQEHEKVLTGPDAMVIIPPRHYAIISNPVQRNNKGEPEKNEHGNYKLRHGDEEIRYQQDPFPLYPGEKLFGSVTALQIVQPDSALRLRCLRDFTGDKGEKRQAGDEWLFAGPGTYYPKVEVQVVEIVKGTTLTTTQGLRLRARRECTDATGIERRTGEEWVYRKAGSYLPGVDEEVVDVINAFVLTDRKALHLRATRTYTDQLGTQRKAGEEWLITNKEAVDYIPDVYEEIVGEVRITVLNNR